MCVCLNWTKEESLFYCEMISPSDPGQTPSLKIHFSTVFVIKQIWIQVGALLLDCVTFSRHLISVYLSFFIVIYSVISRYDSFGSHLDIIPKSLEPFFSYTGLNEHKKVQEYDQTDLNCPQ